MVPTLRSTAVMRRPSNTLGAWARTVESDSGAGGRACGRARAALAASRRRAALACWLE